jgi:hypothetical protein
MKNLNDPYYLLKTSIRHSNVNEVSEILNQNKSLDVTSDNSFFYMSVEEDDCTIVERLLEYFEENQLSKHDSQSYGYKVLKKKMRDILEVAIEDVKISDEMKKVLGSYITWEEDKLSDDDSQDLGSDEEIDVYNSDSSSMDLSYNSDEVVEDGKQLVKNKTKHIDNQSLNCLKTESVEKILFPRVSDDNLINENNEIDLSGIDSNEGN